MESNDVWLVLFVSAKNSYESIKCDENLTNDEAVDTAADSENGGDNITDVSHRSLYINKYMSNSLKASTKTIPEMDEEGVEDDLPDEEVLESNSYADVEEAALGECRKSGEERDDKKRKELKLLINKFHYPKKYQNIRDSFRICS